MLERKVQHEIRTAIDISNQNLRLGLVIPPVSIVPFEEIKIELSSRKEPQIIHEDDGYYIDDNFNDVKKRRIYIFQDNVIEEIAKKGNAFDITLHACAEYILNRYLLWEEEKGYNQQTLIREMIIHGAEKTILSTVSFEIAILHHEDQIIEQLKQLQQNTDPTRYLESIYPQNLRKIGIITPEFKKNKNQDLHNILEWLYEIDERLYEEIKIMDPKKFYSLDQNRLVHQKRESIEISELIIYSLDMLIQEGTLGHIGRLVFDCYNGKFEDMLINTPKTYIEIIEALNNPSLIRGVIEKDRIN